MALDTTVEVTMADIADDPSRAARHSRSLKPRSRETGFRVFNSLVTSLVSVQRADDFHVLELA